MKAMISFTVVLLFLLSASTLGIEVFDSEYQVQTYACYLCPETLFTPRGITCDPFGNLYLSHWEDYDRCEGSIYRIDVDGVAKKWVTGNRLPRKIVWTGLTQYGNLLYIAGAGPSLGGIEAFDLRGNGFDFCTLRYAHALALDPSGRYGGCLFTATRAQDSIYKITPDGNATQFSSFPGDIPNGPVDLCFDPGLNYGGLLYLACYSYERPNLSGIFSIDPQGRPTRFADDIGFAAEIDFNLEGDLFVAGKLEFETAEDSFRIWKVSPAGEVSEFALASLDPLGIFSFTFGPDGALYIPEFLPDYQIVIISKIEKII